MKNFRFYIVLVFISIIGLSFLLLNSSKKTQILKNTSIPSPVNQVSPDPLSIETMRGKTYSGSDITIGQTLPDGSNYHRYIVSYQSDGLKIFGLLTVPIGQKPEKGWPVIIFNHGYISPTQYSTENSYSSFVDEFAQAGYIVFKPDYRGNGNSQGSPIQIYVSPGYLTDGMNAISSIKQFQDADPQRIGVFGHSMGGNIILHELVISKEIKAASIMAGVVGDETDILAWWNQRIAAQSIIGNDMDTSHVVQRMVADHGTPSSNPNYWNAIDPTKYIADITAPVQIQVGTIDAAVPPSFSSSLRRELQSAGKNVDYREYSGADHNLSPDTSTVLAVTVAFFDKYLK